MRKDPHRGLLFPLLVILLVGSLAFPPGAYADDAPTATPGSPTLSTPAPPEGDVGLTEAAPTDDSTPVEATPTPQDTPPPPATDVSPTEAAVTPTDPGLGAPTADVSPTDATATATSGVDAAVTQPAETPVVVLDSEGNQVPLASNEAAQIIASGDPIWCPTGHLPGDPECTSAETTITALIADLALESGAGTIYFAATYSTNDATLNGNDPSLANLTDLTVQGGWNGLTGSSFALSGTTDFTTTLSILNWSGDVTLNDLVVSNTAGDGVYVTTSGDIGLDNVESSGNAGRGAYLDNTSGGSGVAVTVNASSFHDNSTGLEIRTAGDASLADVDASYNTGAGAVISAGGDATIDQSGFSWNGLQGLSVDAMGDVSLFNVDARQNGSDGAQVLSAGDVTIDTASFDLNAGNGLYVQAANMISLTDVQAGQNDASGLYLGAGRDVTLTDVSAAQNGERGASVWADWNILVESSAFDSNAQEGAYLDSLNGDITADCSSFQGNGNYGMRADLPGTLDLSGDTFSGNGAGDYIVTGGGTPVVGSSANCPSASGEGTVVPTATPTAMLPMNVVSVLAGQPVTLNCVSYRGTTLVLPNGDQVILPCPITGQATLDSILPRDLPAALESGLTFLSGMRLQVTPALRGIVTVDFVVPIDQDVSKLSIDRWDNAFWTDLGGIRSADIYFEARSSQDGVFVLVTE